MSGTDVLSAIGKIDTADLAVAGSAECADLLRSTKRIRGWLDAHEARITSRMTELYETQGAAPASDVHARCGGVSAAEGKRKQRRSETLDHAPSFGDALADGRIGAEHVDALANATSRLDDGTKASLLDGQDDLLTSATSMSPEKFGRHVRDRIRSLERDQGLERNTRQRRETFFSRKTNLATGMVEGRFAFHPELAAQIFGAVDREVAAIVTDAERRRDPAAISRSTDRQQLAAEALGRLVAGGHQQARPLEADITVIVDAATLEAGELHDRSLCETSDGLALPPASVARLLCGGVVTPVIVAADGKVLEVGRSVRHANRQQRRALRAMYRTCAFHGCDVAFDRCEIHHVEHWEHGGPTDLSNLVPLCSRHHHVIHELGWSIRLEPDRTLVIVQPDGHEFARSRPDIAEQTRARSLRRRPAA
jgi:hypothetical protein